MNNVGYYNGQIGNIEDMKIPMTDRAIYFGDGVYDAVMCRNNIPYLLDLHINRLFENCATLDIKPPCTKEELKNIIFSLVKRIKGDEKFVYFHISRGSGIREHEYENMRGNLLVTVTERKTPSMDFKMKCTLDKDIRYKLCNIKTLNLIPSVLTAQRAKSLCCDESIMFRNELFVTEGSHSNVSILKDNEIITAPCDEYILPGVTRSHLIEIATKSKIKVTQRRYSVNELLNADEIMITSSSKLLQGVSHIDGVKVGGRDEKTLALLKNKIYEDYINNTAI